MIICPQCLNEVDKLTRDHIVPAWFLRRLRHYDIKKPDARYRKICLQCNHKKAFQLDFSDQQTREYCQKMVDYLQEGIKSERPIKYQ